MGGDEGVPGPLSVRPVLAEGQASRGLRPRPWPRPQLGSGDPAGHLAGHQTVRPGRQVMIMMITMMMIMMMIIMNSMETDKVVMLATEPVEPLELHLENLVDRGPKRDNYIAWGIFQVNCKNRFNNFKIKSSRSAVPSPSSTTTPSCGTTTSTRAQSLSTRAASGSWPGWSTCRGRTSRNHR